jgi:diaminopimelate epimerase
MTSTPIKFHKMHGLGNDFVILDGVTVPESQIPFLGDRNKGIGFDQIILIEPSIKALSKIKFYNQDGSRVTACGNGTRCAAWFLAQKHKISNFDLESPLGELLNVSITGDQVTVSMTPQTIQIMNIEFQGLKNPTYVNIGNEHLVFFSQPPQDLEFFIKEINHHYPQGINVGFSTILNTSHIQLTVWERGVGLTQACGTGAGAAAVAGMNQGLLENTVTVCQKGGDCQIHKDLNGNLTLTGPATYVFSGEICV